MEELTISQAYFAMMDFLEGFYQRTNSDDVAVLLGGMQVIEDWGTIDPAAWEDWRKSVQSVLESNLPEIRYIPQSSPSEQEKPQETD